ncbi:hypothetical protein KKI93_10435 [Xenorhabdus bovienii]|nr:hypothetical protein [Xenorhabdus bovienii]
MDHDDDLIVGIDCAACGYLVFENKEDSFYEICPVCRWQNDGKLEDEYSGCNHKTMNEYRKTNSFKKLIDIGHEKYIKLK